MESVMEGDVLHAHPLYSLELVIVLPDAPKGYPQAIVEGGVRNSDVGAVCFHGQTIVPVIDGPVVERNM